jgi:hypothetical protein
MRADFIERRDDYLSEQWALYSADGERRGIMKNKKDWMAGLVCALAVIPGFVVGGVIVIFVQVLNDWQADPHSDFLYLRAIFGIEAPGVLFNFLMFRLIPNFGQGLAAGAFAIWVTGKFFKEAPLETIAYMTGALYTGMILMAVVLMFALRGAITAGIGFAEELFRFGGLWVGLVFMADQVMTERKYALRVAKPAA